MHRPCLIVPHRLRAATASASCVLPSHGGLMPDLATIIDRRGRSPATFWTAPWARPTSLLRPYPAQPAVPHGDRPTDCIYYRYRISGTDGTLRTQFGEGGVGLLQLHTLHIDEVLERLANFAFLTLVEDEGESGLAGGGVEGGDDAASRFIMPYFARARRPVGWALCCPRRASWTSRRTRRTSGRCGSMGRCGPGGLSRCGCGRAVGTAHADRSTARCREPAGQAAVDRAPPAGAGCIETAGTSRRGCYQLRGNLTRLTLPIRRKRNRPTYQPRKEAGIKAV